MKLVVLKGFDPKFLKNYSEHFLIDTSLNKKINIRDYNKNYIQNIIRSITLMNEDKYLLFEEFVFACIDDGGANLCNILKTFNIDLKIIYNNIYPELYPCYFLNHDLLDQFIEYSSDNIKEPSEDVLKLSKIYNKVFFIEGNYYVMYNNVEYDIEEYERENYISDSTKPLMKNLETECIYEINEDIVSYIQKVNEIESNNYKNIGVKLMGDSELVNELYKSFCAFLNTNEKYNLTVYEKYGFREDLTEDFKNIVSTVLKVPDFKEFRDLDFYENPNLSNNMIKINQTQIMSDMVEQAKLAKKCEDLVIKSNGTKMSGYRDIFVTAPTGAGKSLMFQVPAIYLAEKYQLLTIIITPLIELMNDQVRNLHERGYSSAERLNSSINAIEKKNIVKKIDSGEINLLYLAPETLLSYSIDQLVGSRSIGLVIIDEAHIVSTWGKGFRPDYWYLGSYLDKLRKFRNSKGLKDADKRIDCFPICTFTATAVNGGKFDDVNDIKNSLNLRDTITYYGKVIRDNIKFDIKNHSNQKTQNIDEYTVIKNETFKNVIKKYIEEDKKAIVYFPYASTAHYAYTANADKGFGNLVDLKEHFSIYTGGGKIDSDTKSENMLDFRDNVKKIMFATKAFGMGIDIKDIENVYHYAASGNLNDYVQEIGRVARSKNTPVGIASTDYYDRDLNFMKTLYGMSALHNYQTLKILSIIMNVYDTKKKYNLMVTPDMFRPVFGKCDDDQLEVKIKSALLTIEKDLENRYKGSKPIVTRARNMFTECFATVAREQEESLLKSKIAKYFKKIAKGRYREQDLKYRYETLVTDPGDIFVIDLKGLWEDLFSNKTFGEFKYALYENSFEIFDVYCAFIKLRNKITIKTVDDSPLSELKPKLLNEIDIVSNILNEYQIEGTFFSKDDFANRLEKEYHNRFKAKTIANSYLEILNEYRDSFTQNFFEFRTINDETKYRIVRGNFRSIAEKSINTSSFLKGIRYADMSEYTTYEPSKYKSQTGRDSRYDALNLALLFGLISFEIIGGNKPEIFIRINYPEKIRQIVTGKVNYSNSLIEQAKERHNNDVNILSYFFTRLSSDSDRWKFIENYYLGKVSSNSDGTIIIDRDNLS